MSSRVLIILVIGALVHVGCSVPRPYQKDPLIQNAKRQKGSFEKAAKMQDRPVEPVGPTAPLGELVKGESDITSPVRDRFVKE